MNKKSLIKLFFGTLASSLVVGSALLVNTAKEVKADASKGADYGFVDFKNNPGIEEAFPGGWGWGDKDTSFTSGPLSWKVSAGRRSGLGDRFFLGFTSDTSYDVSSDTEGMTLLNRTSDPDYAGMVAAVEQSSGFGYAIQSVDYIENINDLHFSFKADGGFLYALYHLPTDDEGVWNVIKTAEGEKAFRCYDENTDEYVTTYIGSHGVWNAGYDSFNHTFKYILGDNEAGAPRAKIAFVYWAYNSALHLSLDYISINTDQAAIGYMNSLADVEWCTNPEEPTANVITLGILASHLSEAQNLKLEDTDITGDLKDATTYDNYYLFFEYVCDVCNIEFASSLNRLSIVGYEFGSTYQYSIIAITTSALLLAAVGTIIILKKRKKNK